MLYGDWNAFEGAFFPEFDPNVHVIRPFEIPADCVRFRALDYGLDMTACIWLAVLPDRRVIVYRELYRPGLILSEAAKEILRLTPPGEKIRYTVASPDLWNRRQDSGKSGFEIMTESGLRGLKRADNSRIAGWRTVREYLNAAAGVPRLAIFENCVNLIRCLPALRFDEHVREDAAGTPHEITHAPEALRYALMSREPLFPHAKRRTGRRYIRFRRLRQGAKAILKTLSIIKRRKGKPNAEESRKGRRRRGLAAL